MDRTMTYYVALAFTRSEDEGGIVACEPVEATATTRSARQSHWPRRRGIAGPSRSRGLATRHLAILKTPSS
jgi:hypothetical protein